MRQYQQTTAVLTEQERRRRVAELLCKAIFLAEAKRALEPVGVAADAGELAHRSAMPHDADLEEMRILNYLEVAGRGSPKSIRGALGMSPSATYRALHRLTVAGYVVPSGRTRTLTYGLNQVEPPAPSCGPKKMPSPPAHATTVQLASGNSGRTGIAA